MELTLFSFFLHWEENKTRVFVRLHIAVSGWSGAGQNSDPLQFSCWAVLSLLTLPLSPLYKKIMVQKNSDLFFRAPRGMSSMVNSIMELVAQHLDAEIKKQNPRNLKKPQLLFRIFSSFSPGQAEFDEV
jgi:hypothetical protein